MFNPAPVEKETKIFKNFASIESKPFIQPNRIKLRLESQTTGKEIDLNFSFKFSKTS